MCNISQYLLLTSCTPLSFPFSQHLHSPFHSDILHPLNLLTASMNTSLLSPPYTVFISFLSRYPALPLTLFMHAYLSASALSPGFHGNSSDTTGLQREKWSWNGKLFTSVSSVPALGCTPFPLTLDKSSKRGEQMRGKKHSQTTKSSNIHHGNCVGALGLRAAGCRWGMALLTGLPDVHESQPASLAGPQLP